MGKKISESEGAVVYFALHKDNKRGSKAKITYTVHYKGDSIWCNNMEDVTIMLNKIAAVCLLGKEYKTWTIGKNGWKKDAKTE